MNQFYKTLAQQIRALGSVRLYTVISGEQDGQSLVGQKALQTASALVPQEEGRRGFWEEMIADSRFEQLPVTVQLHGVTVLAENLLRRPRLVICGGGHISLPLAQLGAMLDFDVTVIDDREEFANTRRFSMAQRVLCLPFEEAFATLEPNQNTYYVIVTRGHSADRQCLEEILHRPFAYVGMIGSRRKVAVVMEQMRADGYSEEQLGKVYSPIGIKIGAQTPAEIAVCIAAEIIQVLRQGTAEGGIEDSMLDALLQNDAPMVMATIITKEGSAPRSTGAKMLLSADGSILSGSVGGGAGEGQVCAAAGETLRLKQPQLITCNMTNADAKQAGMVCGGSITVFVEPIL